MGTTYINILNQSAISSIDAAGKALIIRVRKDTQHFISIMDDVLTQMVQCFADGEGPLQSGHVKSG